MGRIPRHDIVLPGRAGHPGTIAIHDPAAGLVTWHCPAGNLILQERRE